MVPGIDVDNVYTIIFSLTDDENNTTFSTVDIPKQSFQVDYSPAGGIGLGTSAPDERICAIAMPLEQGTNTLASSDNQVALGRYNEEDTSGDYALIIGNGTADDARSNAAAITWGGDIEAGKLNGTLTESTGVLVSSDNQTAIGKYNTEDINGDYALIIGNGTADDARSNAATVSKDGDLYLSNGGQKVLWSGYSYMHESQTITLSEPISEQAFGVVLHWTAYANGAPQYYDNVYQYIPKHHAVRYGGKGVGCLLTSSNGAAIGHKYLYVNDRQIAGNGNNYGTNTASGISFNNSYWVLTAVIGV